MASTVAGSRTPQPHMSPPPVGIAHARDKHSIRLMLFVFAKNERDDLSPDQLKILRAVVEDEYP
jgi:hypothetical protein